MPAGWSHSEDGTQGSDATIREEYNARGARRITFTLGVLRRDRPIRERASLVIRCYEDSGDITLSWGRR
jgi:hypothetical protein